MRGPNSAHPSRTYGGLSPWQQQRRNRLDERWWLPRWPLALSVWLSAPQSPGQWYEGQGRLGPWTQCQGSLLEDGAYRVGSPPSGFTHTAPHMEVGAPAPRTALYRPCPDEDIISRARKDIGAPITTWTAHQSSLLLPRCTTDQQHAHRPGSSFQLLLLLRKAFLNFLGNHACNKR